MGPSVEMETRLFQWKHSKYEFSPKWQLDGQGVKKVKNIPPQLAPQSLGRFVRAAHGGPFEPGERQRSQQCQSRVPSKRQPGGSEAPPKRAVFEGGLQRHQLSTSVWKCLEGEMW